MRSVATGIARSMLSVLVILFLAFCIWNFVKILPRPSFKPANVFAWLSPTLLEEIIYKGLPTLVLDASGTSVDATEKTFENVTQALASSLLLPDQAVTGQFLTTDEKYPSNLLPGGESQPPMPLVMTTTVADNPLVAIYNTHNAESYASQGTAKLEGKNGGVSQVAAVLAETLTEDYGIPVVRSTTIHDYPDFTRSYANSEATLRRMLAENPSVIAAFDIHRDAGLASPPVVEINGQRLAQVVIIVGSDQRLEHPDWRQNEAFARKLDTKLNELYPGLSRGIRVQDGRYNQHLIPYSLLLEIGSEINTLEEAERSARLVARVLAQVIEDLLKENPV